MGNVLNAPGQAQVGNGIDVPCQVAPAQVQVENGQQAPVQFNVQPQGRPKRGRPPKNKN